jgi:glutamate carboxypeptidase
MLRIEDFRPYAGQMVELLKRLVEVESPSGDKAALDRLGRLLKGELEARGAQVEVVEQRKAGNHLVARWDNEVKDGAGLPGGRRFLLLCHMDTVYKLGWLAAHPLRQENGRLYGPGTLDMKSGIVLALTVMEVLEKSELRDGMSVTALFTSDEEIGSHTSRRLIERLAQEAGLTLCLEAALGTGALKTARKGTGTIEIKVRGRAAHAGVNHERGVNAIEELAHQVLAAQRLTDYASGTTTSVGRGR